MGVYIVNNAKRAKNIDRLQPSPSSCQCLRSFDNLCYIHPYKSNISIYTRTLKKFGTLPARSLGCHTPVLCLGTTLEVINVQHALLEAQRRRFDDDGFGSDSSSSRSNRLHRRQLLMNDMKVDIPDFEGKLQPNKFVDWLQTIEHVFDYKEIPEEQKVKIVAVKLKKHGLIWWENIKRKSNCDNI
ncbi:hypothetical protein MTR_1g105095 [Medicago truncatula]|uniref:Uncharacterized protein n=1 Tax=Medicago truncatula TaxID=3880 RepID=A0A072VPI6_MEDTR|nr:hypothetical protein MTR_1g105095 [Medicago truncatula]